MEEGGFPIKYKKGGAGVVIQSEGRSKRNFDGVEQLYEECLLTEYGLVKAWKADTMGNLVYRKTARNFNPDIAICSKTTIAEVEEIVPLGSLDPDEIDTPGIFVQRIVKGETYNKPTSAFINASGDSINVPGHVDPVSLLIAKRVAQELKPGMFVKLDLGIPNLVTEFLEKGVIVASASGIIGVAQRGKMNDPDMIDAHGEPTNIIKGGAIVSTNTIMDFLRGGHFHASVVGAFQVSSQGDLANWLVPGVYVRGIGSSMDIVANKSGHLIVAMKHTHKGMPKIVSECSLPLTGKKCVKLIVTELGVFEFRENGLNLIEIGKGVTLDEIRSKTGCGFTVSSALKTMN